MAVHSYYRKEIRQMVARVCNDLLTGTVAGPGSGTFTVAAWEDFPDDYFNKWVEVFDYNGTGVGTSGKPSDWVSSTYTLTFKPAATLTTGDLVEMHRVFTVAEYNDAINLAIDMVKREALTDKVDETLIVNDVLSNGCFETVYTTGWTKDANSTAAINSSYVYEGTYSTSLTNLVSNAGYLTQSITNYGKYPGAVATFKGYALGSTASRIRLSLTDGVTTWYSDYHDAVGWNELEIEAKELSTSLTAITVGCRIETGAAITAYFDRCYLDLGAVWRYTVPTGFYSIHAIYLESDTDGNYDEENPIDPRYYRIIPSTTSKIEFISDLASLTSGRKLRLVGLGYPSTLTADTSTTTINPAYIAYQAAALLHGSRIRSRNVDSEYHEVQMKLCQGLADRERSRLRTLKPPDTKVILRG